MIFALTALRVHLTGAFVPNMNGVYHIQNDLIPGKSFNTNFSSYPALGRPDNKVKFVEVYSAEAIETLYSQVFSTCTQAT